MRDRVVGIVVLVLGVIVLLSASRLPRAMMGDPAGPAVLPLMVAWGLIGCGMLLAVRRPRDTTVGPIWAGGVRLAAVVALLFLYALTLTPLGYLVATTVMLFLVLLIYNPRRHVLNGVVAVGFAALTYGLFHLLLGVYVPPGLLG
jgi:putative tricarboxylic transport membrane protein